MSKERFKLVSAAYLFLRRGEELFLMKRRNTGYADGQYALIAGHKERGETIMDAIVREAEEEAGIRLKHEHLRMVHTMHRIQHWTLEDGSVEPEERLDFFFEAIEWDGEPHNAEPEKCEHVAWFHREKLPATMVPYLVTALKHAEEGQFYSHFGWNGEPSILTEKELLSV